MKDVHYKAPFEKETKCRLMNPSLKTTMKWSQVTCLFCQNRKDK